MEGCQLPAESASRSEPGLGRIILHFDYDCFYAQVVENQQPALRGLPLGVKQKSILATCNYAARRRGVRKLMLISEARKLCPDLVLANGENLSSFRDVSKRLYRLLRAYSWNDRVERLGLDEVFLDVTDMVDYNISLLNPCDPNQSFFHMSRHDPLDGFAFDASAAAGPVDGPLGGGSPVRPALAIRLLLASHLARHLRLKIEEEGYTSACGISTNKLLSKLAGTRNKPRNQTTLMALWPRDVVSFMDGHCLRKVPGIGPKSTRSLEGYVRGGDATGPSCADRDATVREVRMHPDMSARALEGLVGGHGAEKGIGERLWGILHGVDEAEVKSASNIPSQISIEDTYRGLTTQPEVLLELRKLCVSLLARMHSDLVGHDEGADLPGTKKWLAHPKTLRLTTRPKTSPSDGKPYNWSRASRSRPLPHAVFSSSTAPDDIADMLVQQLLLPMFLELHPDKETWDVALLNVCVTNMIRAGTNDPTASGRDITVMFRRQEEVLKDFRVYSQPPTKQVGEGRAEKGVFDDEPSSNSDSEVEVWSESGGWGHDQDVELCETCGHLIPTFAVGAHQRYHILGD